MFCWVPRVTLRSSEGFILGTSPFQVFEPPGASYMSGRERVVDQPEGLFATADCTSHNAVCSVSLRTATLRYLGKVGVRAALNPLVKCRPDKYRLLNSRLYHYLNSRLGTRSPRRARGRAASSRIVLRSVARRRTHLQWQPRLRV